MLTSGKLHPFSDRDLPGGESETTEPREFEPSTIAILGAPGGRKTHTTYSPLSFQCEIYSPDNFIFSHITYSLDRTAFFSAVVYTTCNTCLGDYQQYSGDGKNGLFFHQSRRSGREEYVFLICTEIPNRINQYFVAVMISSHVLILLPIEMVVLEVTLSKHKPDYQA